MGEFWDRTSVLERERAYYPKIKELIDLMNRVLLLLHENVNPGEKLILQEILVNRCQRKSEPASVQIYLDYSVPFLSATKMFSQKSGRVEQYLQKEYSSHQVSFVFYPGTDEIGRVEPGNIGFMNLLMMMVRRWESTGKLISPRHGIESSSDAEQEIFWVDLDDYLSMQNL